MNLAKGLATLLLACAMGLACGSAAADAPRTPQPYRTQLFNLLAKEKNVLDGKSHYQAGFARQFDALLASSKLAKADKSSVPLKKRLLSGPAPEPSVLKDPATGTQWLAYDACQAHRCDEIALRLLFDPASGRMVGKLTLDGQSELLGAPSAAEQGLLAPGQAPLDRIMAGLIDYQAFRLGSEAFERLVAPSCKRSDRQQDAHGVNAEYRCDRATGILEMKISTREGAATPRPYVMFIQLLLAADRFAPIKAQMQARLGKPTASGKDYVRYVYTGDRELVGHGTPVIGLSREDAQTVSFMVGLEQGP